MDPSNQPSASRPAGVARPLTEDAFACLLKAAARDPQVSALVARLLDSCNLTAEERSVIWRSFQGLRAGLS